MTLKKAFFGGMIVASLLNKGAWKVILSDTDIGNQARKNAFAKMDHDRLLRLEDEVQTEIIRRTKKERGKTK